MKEFRPVFGFDGFYEVAKDAEIRSVTHEVKRKNGSWATHHGRTLTPFEHPNGYKQVRLSREGKSTLLPLSKVVAQAWLFVPASPARIKYKDGNRANCHADNLDWLFTDKKVAARLSGESKWDILVGGGGDLR